MRILRLGQLFIFSLLVPATTIHAQQSSTTAPRDNQAVNTLVQCLTAAGGEQAISAIQDFTGAGNISYFWAGQQVTGPVTVRGLGASYLRLDAQLPRGTRSWLVNGWQGVTKKEDGSTVPISYANTINLGGLTLPYPAIAVALNDPSVSISTLGTTAVNGRQGLIVKMQRTFSVADDPSGDLAKLNTKSYVIDAQTFAILETQDTFWSDDGRMLPTKREMVFSNFKPVNGISVPFSTVEKLGGQQTWSLQFDTVTFNSGITPDVFQF